MSATMRDKWCMALGVRTRIAGGAPAGREPCAQFGCCPIGAGATTQVLRSVGTPADK